MISAFDLRERHLAHRLSILHEFIDNRQNATRAGFNCYIDAAMITCRSLFGLLGLEIESRRERDTANPTDSGSIFKFDRFTKIRETIDQKVCIRPISTDDVRNWTDEWKTKVRRVLVAANKCVAHFDVDLEHSANADLVSEVAAFLCNEMTNRITYSD